MTGRETELMDKDEYRSIPRMLEEYNRLTKPIAEQLEIQTKWEGMISRGRSSDRPYFLRNDHEGIVSRGLWNRVQARLEKERQNREKGLHFRKTAHFLYGKVFCAECGEPYRRFTARKASGELYKT